MPTYNDGSVATFKLDATDGGSLTDISIYLSSAGMPRERDIRDLPRLGGNAPARLVGSTVTTIDLEGYYDPTVDEIFEGAISDATPVTRSFEYGPAGNATGARIYTGEAYVASYELSTPGDDTATWTATLAVDGAVTQAVVP